MTTVGGRHTLAAKRVPKQADFLLRVGRFVNRSGKPVLSIMSDDKAEAAMAGYLAALAT